MQLKIQKKKPKRVRKQPSIHNVFIGGCMDGKKNIAVPPESCSIKFARYTPSYKFDNKYAYNDVNLNIIGYDSYLRCRIYDKEFFVHESISTYEAVEMMMRRYH
jgi:hypothetical protein